jgi:hypothetical protein
MQNNIRLIDKILNKHLYTKDFLLEQRSLGVTNWMWWKWGIQWTKQAKKLAYFKKEKEKQLLEDLDLISDIHDLWFNEWWWVKEFYLVNYTYINDVLALLHWTTIFSRWIILIVLFFWLNTIWLKYFNWTNFRTNEN